MVLGWIKSLASKFISLLTGGMRPSVGFWLFQSAFVLLTLTWPAFLGEILLFSFYFPIKPVPAWYYYLITASKFIVPFIGWTVHITAVFRSAKFSKSNAVVHFCRIYPVGFSLFLAGSFSLLVISRFYYLKLEHRLSEPKFILRRILDSGQVSMANRGNLSQMPSSIERHAGNLNGYYQYAVIFCENSIKSPSVQYLERKESLQNDEFRSQLLAALKKWASEESCANRNQGFTAFAAGKISEDSGLIDGWRIDDTGKRINFQKGTD